MTKLNALAKAGVSGAALLIGMCALATPASAAELRGRIIDDVSNNGLPGAVVSIDGTNQSVTSSRDGGFVFPNLKPGSYTVRVDYVGYPDKTVAVDIGTVPQTISIAMDQAIGVESVTITGQRQADRVALQVKRSSESIVDALYSNDVGKLPDQNVAEAVRRLPGVSVANDMGEGRYVIIRGGAPNLANITVNGQTAPAPETDGRAVKLDDIPASLVGSLTVTKTLTADLDANAIAGALDISTLSAFDRGGRFAYGRFSAGHYNMNGETPFEGDVTAGQVWGDNDQYGIIASANYSKRPIESQNFGAGGPTWSPVTSTAGSATLPSIQQLRDYNLTRVRSGGVLNFDYKVDENLEVFVRTMYSSFSDKETRDRFTLNLPIGGTTAKPLTSYSALGTTTGAFTTGASANRYVRSRQEDDHSYNLSTGFKLTHGLSIFKLQGTVSEAIKTDPRRDEWTFKTSGSTISGTYDLTDFTYLVVPDATAYDASKYVFSGLKHENREAAENLFQVRGDYERPIDGLGDSTTIKAGFKWIERVKKLDISQQNFKANKGFTLAMTNFAYDGSSAGDGPTTYEGRYALGPRIDYKLAEAYFLTAHGTRACDATTTGGFYCDIAASATGSVQSDYRVREDVIAGYAMADIKIGQLQLLPGVRVEDTEGAYGMPTSPTSTTSYLDVFPGINAKYTVADDLVLRGAVTTAIGRPEYTQLTPTVVIDTTVTPVNTGTAGNPFVKPLKSVNYDLSFEYYLPGQGLVSVAAFYKDISNPIFTGGVTKKAGEVVNGWTLAADTLVNMPINGGSATYKGVEINLQEQFAFLPSPLDGLGASANFSYIDSAATGVFGRSDTLPLADQSRYVGTAQVYYEKYGVTARLAYSYRSKYLLTVGSDKTTDVYVTQLGQLDARLSYDLSSKTTVFFEAANINGAQYQNYIGTPSHLFEAEKYSYSTKFGVQVKL